MKTPLRLCSGYENKYPAAGAAGFGFADSSFFIFFPPKKNNCTLIAGQELFQFMLHNGLPLKISYKFSPFAQESSAYLGETILFRQLRQGPILYRKY